MWHKDSRVGTVDLGTNPGAADADKQGFLSRSWLAGLPPEIVEDAAARAHWRRFVSGQRVFSRGDRGETFYIVFSGQVRILNHGGARGDSLLTVLDSGLEFGEISILDDGMRTHSAECQGSTTLLCLTRANFLELLARHPALQRRVTQRVCFYLRLAFAAMEDDQLQLAPRLAKRLLLLARMYGVRRPEGLTINLSLSQEDLANMLGMARQSLGRSLRAWKDAGWILQQYRRITITNEAALASVIYGPA